jgi:general L-amino acid transport system permease protein
VAVFVLSLVAIFAYRRYATNLLYTTGRLLPTGWPSIALLIVPTLLAFFVMGQPIGLDAPDPLANRFNLRGGIQIGAPLIALWFALSIYTGAFIAENVRAGIQAVSKGQTEAAAALGLRPRRIMGLVILPQALRVIIPPLISQYLNITKNSSLAIAVGYADITATLGGITLNQTGRAIECVLLLMLFYLVISLLISAGMNVYNNAMKLKER